MDEKPKPVVREVIERDGEIINIYESGAEYSVTRGRLVRPATSNLITSENALQMRQKGIDIAMKAKVRAFAREQGVNVDEASDDELLAGWGNAQEAIHKKAYDLFMGAKTPRAAEGLYLPLLRLPGETEKGMPPSVFVQNNIVSADVARTIAQIISDVMSVRDAIDGEVKEVKPFGGIHTASQGEQNEL